MTSISIKIDSIKKKLIALKNKIEQLELENASLKIELQRKIKDSESLELKYKDGGEGAPTANEEIEEIRSAISRFDEEIETCINMIEQVL